ncbi:MAG TPA: hypothetical protein VGP82_17050 [Ktedonobacterales bacterium]|nr:hypothetical protein [Ktedonobacterales bacterium]
MMKVQRCARIVLLIAGIAAAILLVGCGGSYGSAPALAQQQISAVQVKTELPTHVQVDHSYALRISLVPRDSSRDLSDIVVEQTTVASTAPTPVGTPGATIARAFGAGYEPYATATLYSGTFDVRLAGQQTQSLRQQSMAWTWNITPHQTGAQVVTGAIYIEWKPTKQPNNALPPPTYTIATIDQSIAVQGAGVSLPLDPSIVTAGKIDIGSLVTQILAALLAAALIWWVSVVVVRSLGGHRKAQQRGNAQVGARPTDRDRHGGR